MGRLYSHDMISSLSMPGEKSLETRHIGRIEYQSTSTILYVLCTRNFMTNLIIKNFIIHYYYLVSGLQAKISVQYAYFRYAL